MPNIQGYITVFEATDGGSGLPAKTNWQFFVCNATQREAVTTVNPLVAEAVMLAIKTTAFVRVSYDAATRVAAQVRMTYDYSCVGLTLDPCPNIPGDEPKIVCVTKHFTTCKPGEIPPSEDHTVDRGPHKH